MFRKIRLVLKRLRPSSLEKLFLKERISLLSGPRSRARFRRLSGPVLLIEMSSDVAADRTVPLSTFLDAFKLSQPNAPFVGFVPDLVLEPELPALLSWARNVFFYLIPSSLRRLYKACGVQRFQFETFSRKRMRQAEHLASTFLDRAPSKREILHWTVDHIRIGDLMYDHYLRAHRKATIEVRDPNFRAFAIRFVSMFLFWKHFFDAEAICGVVAQNHEYGMGVPLRLASEKNIPGFYIQMNAVVTVSKKIDNPRNVLRLDLRRDFDLSVAAEKESLRRLAEERLGDRLKGEVGPEIGYMASSSFLPTGSSKVIEDKNRTNVLIAAHRFYDSCNVYGEAIFPDFWEWLLFLGETSAKSDFDWYIKKHPRSSTTDRLLIDDLVGRFPSIRKLPDDVSNLQLVEQGIAAVLTVYGTVAHEFPALGVPVINATANNPHVEWDFSFHAGSLEDFKLLLGEIPNLRVPTNGRAEIIDFLAARIQRENVQEPLFLRKRNLDFNLRARGHNENEHILNQWMAELKSNAYQGTVDEVASFLSSSVRFPAGNQRATVFSRDRVIAVS